MTHQDDKASVDEMVARFESDWQQAVLKRASLEAAFRAMPTSRRDEDEVIEKCAQALLDKIEGGHCGEGTTEIIARQSRNAVLRECAEIVRALKSPPTESQEGK